LYQDITLPAKRRILNNTLQDPWSSLLGTSTKTQTA